jgi:fibronectin-binding autotransporter adhesin
MVGRMANRRVGRVGTDLLRLALLGSVSLVALNWLGDAQAGQLPTTAFQTYDPATAASIQPGPFALFTVPVNKLRPTQMNEGFTEVDKKATGFDILTPSQLQPGLIPDIEPVVIGPGGVLYLTDGHHTFTALLDSAYGSSNPNVYVNVVANYSNLTTSQFWAQMQASNLLLPLNDGVPQIVNTANGSPIPTSLTALTQDPYRGLEYSILKNKNSKLFKNASNISGAAGSAIPGLDKITGTYGDFIWADAYRNANGGRGLPTLSPGDIQLATQWNLNPSGATTEPNVGAVTAAQLPGFILNKNIAISSMISNSTLATGTLDGNGGFTGITSFNLGTPGSPIIVGTPQSGFVMQLGNDSSFAVTLSGANTYTGGTTIIAGNLIVANDAALGAASAGFAYNPNSILGSVQAANGIIFNSLTEGNGTLTIGTSPGNGTGTFTTNRPIAVDGEAATINVNGNIVTLGGQIVSLGTIGTGLGNATGVSDLTIDDLNLGVQGKLILNTPSPNFFGNIIVGHTGTPTVEVFSDAALGNTALPANELGQIELNGGTLQAGASFSSARSLFLGGGSTYDTNGFVTSFAGNLQDVQRTLTVINSNPTTAGAVSFGTFEIGSVATLNINAGSGNGGGAGNAVTFTNGIIRDPGGALILQPTTASNLGSSAPGTPGSENVFDTSTGPAATNAVTNGIVAPWIVVYGATPTNQTPNSPFSFATYGANGFTATAGNSTSILTATATSSVQQSTSITGGTVTGSLQAYALSVQNGIGIALNGNTLGLGDGSHPAGLILNGGASITNGTLNFAGSEGIIWFAGQSNNTNTISATISGSGGLTFVGGVHATDLGNITKAKGLSVVNINTASTETGAIIIDSGAVTLNAVNVFSGSVPGVFLQDTKSSPSPATLNITKSNQFSALSSAGNNSSINVSGAGVQLIIGDGNNENSSLSSTITQSTNNVAGALTKNGTGLLDISGASVSLGTGSSVVVNAGALRIGNGVFGATATNPISVASGAELQYSGNFGSALNDPIQGGGVFHLVGGTVQLTGTNAYTGGTVIEIGAILDVTTANLPTNAVISNAGGTLVFDQTTTGTFSGVMGDGQQSGGPNDPNDMACTLVGCAGPTLSGNLIKDDSTHGNGGNVTLSSVQTYSGLTYIEAGTLTLGAVDAIKTSAGVVLGRVGGAVCNPSPCSGVTATLALGANNTISGLADNPGNTTSVQLNGHVLTLAPLASLLWSYTGSIVDGSATGGGLVQNGPGVSILTGTSTYTGPTTVNAGTLEVDGTIAGTSGVTVNAGGTLTGVGTIDPPAVAVNSGGTFAPGAPGMPGTSMTIAGNLAFQSGAIYLVQLNSASTTFANVAGTAALAGNVLAAFAPGTNPQKQYTILQSAGLNGTTFAAVGTANLPNFNASLSYTNGNVLLNLSANLGSGTSLNGNQQNAATSIGNFFNNGGTLPANFLTVFGLSGGNLQNALSQLSGEAATGGERGAFQMMTQFLGLMPDSSVDGRSGNGGGAIGFAPEQAVSFPPDITLAYARVLKAPPKPTFDQRWSAWGSSYGGGSTSNGDPAVGSSTVTANTFGFAGGLDYHVARDTVVGFALAGGGTSWGLAQGLGGGRSDAFQAGIYGITHSGPAYLSAALAFTNHWMTTNRVAFAGDQLTAKFDAQSYGARLEAGYRHALLSSVGVTPYGAVQAQDFHTPSYAESDLTGGGFGLSYNAMSASDFRSELGARLDHPTWLGNMPLMLRARVAWAHDWVSNPSLNAVFESLPGASFTVNGAPVPKNSALTSAGGELSLAPNWSLTAKFDGEFARGTQTYAGSGKVRYTW